MPPTHFEPTREFARQLDREDPLAGFRDQFHIPKTAVGEDEIYFCGHSLGLQPKRTHQFVMAELEDWARLGVKGHFDARHPWLPYHRFLSTPMAELVGATGSEVVVMNSLTANLHLMMVSFYRPAGSRYRILIEERAFPSDRYAVESQVRFHGFDPADALITVSPREGEQTLRLEDLAGIVESRGATIALMLLPGVQYLTGQAFDIEELTRLGRRHGCVVGFDLAHAAGNLELRLHDGDVDFAVWCTYKYLNSGPGSMGAAFVHERHAGRFDLPRFAGWWGHDQDSRFRMEPEFRPMRGAEGWQLSNPSILSMAAIRSSLELFTEAGGMNRLRPKSIRLTGYLEHLIRERAGESIEILTPSDPTQRGCQLSLRVRRPAGVARHVFERLTQRGITCDWREPDVIRVAPVPLYNRYEDVWVFVDALREILA